MIPQTEKDSDDEDMQVRNLGDKEDDDEIMFIDDNRDWNISSPGAFNDNGVSSHWISIKLSNIHDTISLLYATIQRLQHLVATPPQAHLVHHLQVAHQLPKFIDTPQRLQRHTLM